VLRFAFEARLSTTVCDLNADIGLVIAPQGKYFGNFARNDFRLVTLGHTLEKFANGALNIVSF
jgi:hypothetical protein